MHKTYTTDPYLGYTRYGSFLTFVIGIAERGVHTMQLKQRTGLERYTFDLMEDGVRIKAVSFSGGGTHVVPYTAIPHTPSVVTTSSFAFMAMTLITLGLTGICTLAWLGQPAGSRNSAEGYVLLCGLCVGLAFLSIFIVWRKSVLVYSDGSHIISIRDNSPSPETVQSFAREMDHAKFAYYQKCIRRVIDADPNANPKAIILNLLQGGYLTDAQADNLEQALELTTSPGDFGFVSQGSAKSA